MEAASEDIEDKQQAFTQSVESYQKEEVAKLQGNKITFVSSILSHSQHIDAWSGPLEVTFQCTGYSFKPKVYFDPPHPCTVRMM